MSDDTGNCPAEDCRHVWESGERSESPNWGVIIGVSKCEKCGVTCKTKDVEQ